MSTASSPSSVALGAELAPDLVPELSNVGHNFYSLSGAEIWKFAVKSENIGSAAVYRSLSPENELEYQ